MPALIALIAALLAFPALAQIPPAPQLDARAWALADYPSGQLLVSSKPETRVEPASLTKLMTAYVVFEAVRDGHLALDQVVPVSTIAWQQEGSRMFIEPRSVVNVEQLLNGMIVQSGNDASVALAEAVAGSEAAFAELMNRAAARLGLKDTHFENATGLPGEQHYTTVADLAVLAGAIIRDFPDFYRLYSKREYTYGDITQPNRNRLLWLDTTVDGMKTGHTSSAGYCLVSSAQRGPQRLISVVVGASSDETRTQESLKLLNFGFQFFESARLYAANQPVSSFRVWKGEAKQLNVGFEQDLNMTLPRGEVEKLQVTLESRQPLLAPVARGEQVGLMQVSLDGKPMGSYPVVALADVPESGFVSRFIDALVLWFKSL